MIRGCCRCKHDTISLDNPAGGHPIEHSCDGHSGQSQSCGVAGTAGLTGRGSITATGAHGHWPRDHIAARWNLDVCRYPRACRESARTRSSACRSAARTQPRAVGEPCAKSGSTRNRCPIAAAIGGRPVRAGAGDAACVAFNGGAAAADCRGSAAESCRRTNRDAGRQCACRQRTARGCPTCAPRNGDFARAASSGYTSFGSSGSAARPGCGAAARDPAPAHGDGEARHSSR